MGFQDRRYEDNEGEGGGFRRAMRRIFVEGTNFFEWAIPLPFRVAGIRIRIHLLFILMIVIELIMSLPHGATGIGFRAMLLACLFGMVLLHEFGHCFACRWVGGEADDILMWPLGGLASCSPPHNWKAHLITTAGGPLVNVALTPVLAGLMLAAGASWEHLLFNPFDPNKALAVLGFGAWWKIAVFYSYFTNLVLLIFNLVLPMFPMDGARIVQELMWAKMGWRRSMLIAVNIGLVTAVAVGLFSIVTPDTQRLFGLAIFGGLICMQQRQQLAMTADEPEYDLGKPSDYGYGPRAGEVAERRATSGRDREYEAALSRQKQQQSEQTEVDRVLAKIAQTGMGSLSRSERKVLERETERKRNQGGRPGGAGGGGRGTGTTG
jgi:Zn-dependent protease